MITLKKKLLALASLAFAVTAAPAFATTVGGVIIQPNGNNVIQVADVYEQFIGMYSVAPGATTVGTFLGASVLPGAQLAGYGRVATVNGNNNFCANGPLACELTFRFYGYTALPGGTASNIDFTGGRVDFYLGTGASLDFNPAAATTEAQLLAEATNGTPWLSVVGRTFRDDVTGRTGTLLAQGVNFGTGSGDSGTGIGQLEIVGGLADVVALLDTNTINDHLGCTTGVNCSDFDLTTSFSTNGAIRVLPLDGGASVAGQLATQVPEPASLSLMALGLIGLGAAGRRRRQK